MSAALSTVLRGGSRREEARLRSRPSGANHGRRTVLAVQRRTAAERFRQILAAAAEAAGLLIRQLIERHF